MDLQTSIGQLLADLSETQDQVLLLLNQKQKLLRSEDFAGLQKLEAQEQALLARLQGCRNQRNLLLAQASEEGLAADSLSSLAARLPGQSKPGEARGEIRQKVKQATSQSRLLQHASLTNWVIAQRCILHISQILEILATGRPQRTSYGRGEAHRSSGALMDQQG